MGRAVIVKKAMEPKVLLQLSDRQYVGLLLGIFFFALTLRVTMSAVFVGLNAPPKAEANPDQIDYEFFAYRMARGEGYSSGSGLPTAARPPGTSLTLLPVYVSLGRWWSAGRVWFGFLSALTCLIAAWITEQLAGRLAALLAALWVAIYPGSFYYAMHFLSEAPYQFFITLACAVTLYALRQRSIRWNIGAGCCWGMAVLTRPNGILVLPILALLILFARHERWFYVRHIAAQGLGLALVLTPWLLRNALMLGTVTLSTVGGETLWGCHNSVVLTNPSLAGSWLQPARMGDAAFPIYGDELQQDRLKYGYALDFIAANVKSMPYLELMKLRRLLTPFEATENNAVYWIFALGWPVAAVFVLIGIVMAFRRNRIVTWIILTPILATIVTALIFYGSIRFRDSVAPLLLVFAAVGLGRLLESLFGLASPGEGVLAAQQQANSS